MTTYALHRRGRVAVRRAPASVHLLWLAAGGALAFLVPYVLADRLELPKDLYYAAYSLFVVALFSSWARATGQSVPALLRRRLPLTLALAAALAVVMAAIVVRSEDAGPRPGHLELAGAIVWRGLVYGAADGILLSAFPILVVFAALASTPLRRRLLGKIAVGLAALLASLGMTAVYHAGYSDFRSEKLGKPVAGALVWAAPTLLTLNPVGAPIVHAAQHVTAVVHDYDTDLYLPPHR